jgi:hypothetical protein
MIEFLSETNTVWFILFLFSFFAPHFRWIWYLRMVLAQEEQNQKLGIVNITYMFEGYARPDLETLRLYHREFLPAIPLKNSARYVLFSDIAWKQVIDFEQVIMSRIDRVRFRTVSGK